MEKLYDSELKVMEVLWSQGDKTAREIADKGYTAMVKKNKDGYLILKQECKIVRRDNVSADKEL